LHALIIAVALTLSGTAYAQTCNDFNECTNNDMCGPEGCMGSFEVGGSCDDFQECTINDRCQNDPILGGICRGDPAPAGTVCSGGCGECLAIVGGAVTCAGDPENSGQPCDLAFGGCLGACQFFEGGFTICLPDDCPDTDGNPCTDNCNFETGECEVNAPKSIPTCETCNQSNGECEPANLGASCDDFDLCTAQSRCEFNDDAGRTFCVEGEGTGPTPTTPGEPTPTVPPGECVGDCNDNGVVVVNELIIGVNIALDSAEVADCLAFDTNWSGGVEVNELVGGVNALLNGCA
jgi:hypothetical protein